MELVTIVLYGGGMFVLGMYVTTQISRGIDSNIRQKEFMRNFNEFDKRKSEPKEETYYVPASEWDDEGED